MDKEELIERFDVIKLIKAVIACASMVSQKSYRVTNWRFEEVIFVRTHVLFVK